MGNKPNKPMAFLHGFIIYILFNIVFNILGFLFVFITRFPIIAAIFGFIPLGGKIGIWIATALAAYAAKIISIVLLDAISKYSYETNILAIKISGIFLVIFYVYKGVSAFFSGDIYSIYVIAALFAVTMLFT